MLGARKTSTCASRRSARDARAARACDSARPGGRAARRAPTRRFASCDLDLRRVVQQRLGELADLVRERGREEQVLPLLRQHREDAADVADEAHVEHLVGLVEDEDLDVAQVDRLLLHVVEEAPWCRDEDVDPASERVDLRVDADAAVDERRPQRHVLAVGAYASSTCAASSRVGVMMRARMGCFRRRACVPVCREALQQWQREAGGLAGARLGAGEDVAAGEDERNGLRLDGRARCSLRR